MLNGHLIHHGLTPIAFDPEAQADEVIKTEYRSKTSKQIWVPRPTDSPAKKGSGKKAKQNTTPLPTAIPVQVEIRHHVIQQYVKFVFAITKEKLKVVSSVGPLATTGTRSKRPRNAMRVLNFE